MISNEPTDKRQDRPPPEPEQSTTEPMHFPCTDPTNPFQPPDPTRSAPVAVPEIDLPPPDYTGSNWPAP